jgi:hypothetical protein
MDNKTTEEKLKKILTGVAVVAGLGVLGFLLVYAPDGKEISVPAMENLATPVSETKTAETLQKEEGIKKELKGIDFFPEEGRTHVPKDTRVTYKTNPPTSGFHYDKWLPPSVYEEDKTIPELLVHNLEHGNVVIYFDRASLNAKDNEALLMLPRKHAGQWDGVVLVNKKGMEQPIILTAWRTSLFLKEYDSAKVSAFLDAFLGRGPENPVR